MDDFDLRLLAKATQTADDATPTNAPSADLLAVKTMADALLAALRALPDTPTTTVAVTVATTHAALCVSALRCAVLLGSTR